MGAELAKEVTARAGHLSGNAFKVLNRMAWTALDKPNDKGQPPRLYFGGWEPLALAMGHETPGLDDANRERRLKQLQKYVSAALTELFEHYAFDRLSEHAHAGTRQTFLLTPGRITEKRDKNRPGRKGKSTPESGGHKDPGDQGSQHPKSKGAEHPGKQHQSTPELGVPRKEQDLEQDLVQDINSHPTALPTDRQLPDTNSGIRITAGMPHDYADDGSGMSCDVCFLPQDNERHNLWRASA